MPTSTPACSGEQRTLDRTPFAGRWVDLRADPEPIAWAVEGFAALGVLTMLAASTATGKTWLALQLADGVARGGQAAGLRCLLGRPLYLDAENGPAIIGRRLRDADLSPDLAYLDMSGARLDRPEDHVELVDAIRHFGATFVVLDSFRRLAPGVREDSSDSAAQFIGGLAQVARETHAAILLQHHRSTKPGAATVRGSSAIEDQTDVLFTMAKVTGGAHQLAAAKFRLGRKPDPLTLRFQDEPPRFVAAEARDSAKGALVTGLRALEGQVAAEGGWTFARLGAALDVETGTERGRKALRRALDALVAEGSWHRVDRGQYGPTA